MTAYVALATNANPDYAIYTPIVVRLWERLGFKPILVLHNDGWDSKFMRLVFDELPGNGMPIVQIPRIEPLSIGNTMRVARLAVAAHAGIEPDDTVITADMDMAPLSRTWFEDAKSEPMLVYRADMYGSLPGASAIMPNGLPALICGLFRFPLCYVNLSARIWFEVLPLVKGDIVQSIRRILHGLRHDQVDYDEATCSARLLLSHRCVGELREVAGRPGWWEQGELKLVPMTDWPYGQPKGMLLGGAANASKNPDAIDFHMPKPAPDWIGRVLSHYWQEEANFLTYYWPRAMKLRDAR